MFYLFNPVTKIYTITTKGQPNPLVAGEFFTPAFSTEIKPPDLEQFKAAVFNGSGWGVIDDNTKRALWRTSDASKIVFIIGDSVDDSMTSENPKGLTYPLWGGATWEENVSMLKKAHKDKIRDKFRIASTLPVIIAGVKWDGGHEGARRKDDAIRLTELTGGTLVTFYDANNKPHDLSFEDALDIVKQIGITFQQILAKKQKTMVAVDDLPDDASLEDIETIKFNV